MVVEPILFCFSPKRSKLFGSHGQRPWVYKILNESVVLPVANWQAACWFYPNTQTIWDENAYVLDRLTLDERQAIGDELKRMKATKDSTSDITWRLRRLVFRKRKA